MTARGEPHDVREAPTTRWRTLARSWFSSAVYALDDRGRRVEIHPEPHDGFEPIDPSEDDWPPEPEIMGPPKPPARGFKGVSKRIGKVMFAIAGAALFLSCLLHAGWSVSSFLARISGVPRWAGPLILVALVAALRPLALAALGKFSLANAVEQVLPAWLTHAHCAACGYGLASMPVEADGCSVCPECGAAWNLAAWKRDYPALAPMSPPEREEQKQRQRLQAHGLAIHRPWPELRDQLAGMARTRFWSVQRADAVRAGVLIAIPVLFLSLLPAAMRGVIVAILIADSLVLLILLWQRGHAARTWAADQIRAELLAQHRCPHCEDRLRDEPRPRDGQFVCDGCGNAWEKQRAALA